MSRYKLPIHSKRDQFPTYRRLAERRFNDLGATVAKLGRSVVNHKVLDLGCDIGHFVQLCRANGVFAVGVDIRMRFKALRNAGYGLPYSVGWVQQLPVLSECVDIVADMGLTTDVRDWQEADGDYLGAVYQEAHRALKPGGLFASWSPDIIPPQHLFKYAEQGSTGLNLYTKINTTDRPQ